MIYLARHGETEWNEKGILQGTMDSPLTKKGISEAKTLRDTLKDVVFDKVFCSYLERSRKTAEIICEGKDVDIISLDGLQEINYGSWQGTLVSEIKEKHPETFYNFTQNHESYVPIEGAESYRQLEERVRKVFDEIFGLGKTENILVISHGAVVQMVQMILKGLTLKDMKNIPVPKNAACMKINPDLTYSFI